jgi:hypothetical protein
LVLKSVDKLQGNVSEGLLERVEEQGETYGAECLGLISEGVLHQVGAFRIEKAGVIFMESHPIHLIHLDAQNLCGLGDDEYPTALWSGGRGVPGVKERVSGKNGDDLTTKIGDSRQKSRCQGNRGNTGSAQNLTDGSHGNCVVQLIDSEEAKFHEYLPGWPHQLVAVQ